MNVEDVRADLAQALRTVDGMAGRVFDYPPDTVAPPSAYVTYPESGTFDETYGRGMDSLLMPIVVVTGRVTDRTALTRLSGFMSGQGGESVARAVDRYNSTATAYDDARVSRFETDPVLIGGVDYIAAIFDVEVFGQGDPTP